MREPKVVGVRRRLLTVIQAALSIALLTWLLTTVSWPSLLAVLANAAPLYMLLACGLYYVGVTLSCWKWLILLRLEGFDPRFGSLLRWYLIGSFAGQYLPTEIGGDLGRGYVAAHALGKPLLVARSILLERLSGLVVMLLLAWLGLIVLFSRVDLALVLLVAALASAFLLWAAPWRPGSRPSGGTNRIGRLWHSMPQAIQRLFTPSYTVPTTHLHRPGALALVAALSIAFQVLSGLGVWLNMRAVGAAVAPGVVVLAAAIIGIAGLLPIALNGWGVREGLSAVLLVPFGVSPAQAIAGALLGRALLLLVTLPGIVFLIFERRRAAQLLAERHPQPSTPTRR